LDADGRCVVDGVSGAVILGDITMNSPIIHLAKSTPAVQGGFLIAGIATAGIAAVQSVFIVIGWLVSAVV
jgi:hypothetical protein